MTKEILQKRLESLQNNKKEVIAAIEQANVTYTELQQGLIGLEHRINEIELIIQNYDSEENSDIYEMNTDKVTDENNPTENNSTTSI